MKIKYLIPILLLCLTIPFTYSKICESRLDNSTNCTMTTPNPVGCGTPTYDIVNVDTNTLMVDDGTLTQMIGGGYYFNFSQGAGNYLIVLCDNSTREFRVTETYDTKLDKEADARMYMAIGIFLAVVTFVFIFAGVFSKNKAFQIFFGLMAMLMCVVDFFMAGKISEVAGADTGLTSNLYTIYGIGLYIFRFLIIIAIIVIFMWVVTAIKNWRDNTKLAKETDFLQFK